ncbi:hypothetical protein RUM43_000656 [Polyplax serrata]|uniref:Serine/threonine-protein phosphatase CPPED1 n=1 Tax=Polyplax serrata TaxID=468196 RepID=A0AAN8SE93_POLSC
MNSSVSRFLLAANRKFQAFEEDVEKNWNGEFFFVQGADTQFGLIARELENKNVITWEKEIELTEKIIDQINQMRPKPRFFVICGDLCDAMPDTELAMRKQQEADFKKLFEKLDKDIPLICICGNHDVGNTPTKETVQLYKSSFGDDYFSFWCGGILFLAINSQFFFDSSKVPDLAIEQEKWIEKKLTEAENKRIIVFQHIPWFLKSDDEEDNYFNIGINLRQKWLDKFKKAGVEGIFCGHYHRNAGGVYNGMQVVVTSAVGGQLGDDKSGARIIKVQSHCIEHKYYEINLKSNDETVKELENLKGFIGVGESPAKDEVSVTKSRVSFFVDDNGKKTGQLKLKNEVDKNGKVVAKVQEEVGVVNNKGEPPQSMTKTEIEIPSKGIHDFFVKTGPRAKGSQGKTVDRQNEVEKNNFSGGIGYGPLDMAEYIYWTGDEKNVALMIEQFLQKGLISRQEAINFLQSIKLNLDFMEARDKNLQKFDKKSLLNVAKSSSYELPMSPVNYEKTDQEYNKLRNSIAFDPKPSKSAFKASSGSNDNEEAMERLRLADQLYKEYSLEEIIYQLAKVMFTQSLGKGNTEAQNALHKLVTFFQKEVKNGQVSRNLERKLLGKELFLKA